MHEHKIREQRSKHPAKMYGYANVTIYLQPTQILMGVSKITAVNRKAHYDYERNTDILVYHERLTLYLKYF